MANRMKTDRNLEWYKANTRKRNRKSYSQLSHETGLSVTNIARVIRDIKRRVKIKNK